ncbi:membrane protein [Citricoccus zhacaiensis]|uniref:Membrane protein n=2 Tax=Citricoccus zhacaiensis TaxID=489142 RepID=A0ABQ2M7D3_9MICC|nr:membrane protein [Citricoccus zhacaiensis]
MLKRRTAVLWAIAAGAIILGTGAQTWIESTQISGLPGDSVTTTGNEAAAVVPAMALVGMAAGIALSMARRIGRWITSLLLLLAGAATAWSSLQAALDPAGAARTQVSEASGTTADAGAYAVTAWPWLTLVGGILLFLCGLAVILFGRRWTTTRRYEAAPATRTATGATGATAATTAVAPDAGDTEDLDEIDAWDELSRGQDPT